MDQDSYERIMLRIIAVGVLLSIAEFIVVGLVIGRATLIGLHDGLLAGVGQMISVVVLVWITTLAIKPKDIPISISS